MSSFTPAEIAYLQSQRLGRLATVGPDDPRAAETAALDGTTSPCAGPVSQGVIPSDIHGVNGQPGPCATGRSKSSPHWTSEPSKTGMI